ncbi:type II CRISPR RNA-guided endonuclease Cas9 [Suttonella indologenes]|uniref:CRISPR-associated endonuclease Cas9 n=1 Tax=Suttonella indologenes TaxID=13276 RepID=A0A380MYP0_9GAMM|nr:type II CRISPR RNA-guided endonuclease Cas9 [Suttonella indologenes]SUO97023.1 Uncharacterized protein conserved in bacteria [Suttonella indologenes]
MAQQNYILGLDLGIASVGWACVWIDENEHTIGLLDCGVRTFERAEVPKTGDSLAKARREARSVRRLIRRRAHRLLRLRRLLKREGILKAADFGANRLPENLPIDAWALRVAGLDKKLAAKEWAAVLLHLVKHRGYLSQRKSELQEDGKSELGRLLAGVAQNHELLQADEYRTPAELAVKYFAVQSGHLRNKGGDYSHTFNRLDLQKELHLLFEKQREFGNPFASADLEAKVDALLMTQRSALQGEAVLKMLGKCRFESSEYKAAKNTYSAERFIWLTKLNNLRIMDGGEERALADDERRLLLDEPYQKSKLTYAQVRKILALPESAVFKGLRYGSDAESAKKAESGALMEMKAYHKIRTVLEKAGLKAAWNNRIRNPELLDRIGTAFSVYKTDEDIQTALADLGLPENVLDALLKGLSFDKFIELSLLALHKILPQMEKGLRYDEACKAAYGDHRAIKENQNKRLLPPIPADVIRNPVVLRTLTQVRKVVNAIIRRYGSPARVHIETARELGKSFKDRKEIEKKQEENRKERERAVERFKELFPHFAGEPKGQDILKLRLYRQQHGKCLYSGNEIDLSRLNEKGYVEIDHALPFSRTWDDSLNNKVLVLGSENQKKRNQTPYEYLDGASNSRVWREFQARLAGCDFPYGKKQRIQTAKLDTKAEQGFLERNLNDTRYIARFLCGFVEENLYLSGKGKRRVFASNGSITALLRGLWGLQKVREENDRHHALDAIVVACSTVSMQQKITKAIQGREILETVDTATGEVKTRIPQPWEFFRQEVMIRVFSDNPHEELAEKLSSRPEAVHEFVKPLFVSRAPNRKMTGQGHLETVRSAKRLDEGVSVVKKPLTALKLKDIEKIVGYPDREPALYDALRQRLQAFKDEPAKAFAEPFYKPAKDGRQSALVKAVRVEDVQKSGVMVRDGKGIADNATMVRVDVFTKGGKNYLVPIYAWQVAKGILPNRAVVARANESDWDEMDESFEFKFSLYPNDLVEVVSKKGRIFGYFASCHRGTGNINIRIHDLDSKVGKDGMLEGVGVKTAISFKKYQVDPLGKEIRLCKAEKRPELKNKKS